MNVYIRVGYVRVDRLTVRHLVSTKVLSATCASWSASRTATSTSPKNTFNRTICMVYEVRVKKGIEDRGATNNEQGQGRVLLTAAGSTSALGSR